jgi:arginyl-tRNA synthetase
MKTQAGTDISAEIKKATTEALLELGATEASFVVEWPADMAHGDYATNAAMAAAKTLGKNPRELASALAPLIAAKLEAYVSHVEPAGPGFINITLSRDAVSEKIAQAIQLDADWGKNTSQEGKRVIIEFSCPNPFKEMHIGHMMSTIIGESIARLTEFSGAVVCRDTYGGDVGPHVAKALWALQKKNITEPVSAEEIGKAYAQGSRAYESGDGDTEAKAEIDAVNVALYKGEDHALMELWRKGRDVSVQAFRDLYRILDTHFDYYIFESETAPIGLRIVQDAVQSGVFEESDGAIIFNGEKRGKEKGLHTLVFITSRGTPTYEAKDIGLAFLKEERWPSDESIILTAAEQVGHFKVFLAALSEIAPALAAKTHHVPHGFLRLTTGKMSSRDGNIISAHSLITDVIEKALERNPDPLIAEQVATGAIKYAILKSAAGSDIIFEYEKSLSLEGDSGPYLQYALARAKSIIANSKRSSAEDTLSTESIQKEAENLSGTYDIDRLIIRFPEVVEEAQKFLAPHTIAHYLTQLASEWNSFYAQEKIIGSSDETHKLQIAEAFVVTMQNGLKLLGISSPEKM